VGGVPGFDGALREVSLEKLPLDRFVPDLVLAGVADLEVDVRSGDAGPSGRLELAAHDGRIGVPGMPVDLPYATLEGRAELGGETRVRLERLHMDGPMLSFDADGTLGQGPSLESSPLDATVRVEVREPSVRPMVRNLGVRLDRDGRAEVRLAGTPARPVVR
jgi:hypothetical protein